MTPDELAGALRLLHAAYQGEWTDERNVLWADALQRYPIGVTVGALRSMVETERWPSLAVFHEHARALEAGPYFAPGSGHLALYEPEPRVEPDAAEKARVLDGMRATRARWAREQRTEA